MVSKGGKVLVFRKEPTPAEVAAATSDPYEDWDITGTGTLTGLGGFGQVRLQDREGPMTRDQAIKAIADKIGLSGPFTNNLVDATAVVM